MGNVLSNAADGDGESVDARRPAVPAAKMDRSASFRFCIDELLDSFIAFDLTLELATFGGTEVLTRVVPITDRSASRLQSLDNPTATPHVVSTSNIYNFMCRVGYVEIILSFLALQ